MDESETPEMRGICHAFFETGTEGTYWAFQDERHIKRNVVKSYCKKCGKYLDEQPAGAVLKVLKVLPLTEELLEGGAELQECAEGEHVRDVGDEWSYEGLHILRTGDHLTIYEKDDPSKEAWSGTVTLHRYAPFTEHVHGMWIHSEQAEVPREKWAEYFIREHPAKLIQNQNIQR